MRERSGKLLFGLFGVASGVAIKYRLTDSYGEAVALPKAQIQQSWRGIAVNSRDFETIAEKPKGQLSGGVVTRR